MGATSGAGSKDTVRDPRPSAAEAAASLRKRLGESWGGPSTWMVQSDEDDDDEEEFSSSTLIRRDR
jgi:hypothetical protein